MSFASSLVFEFLVGHMAGAAMLLEIALVVLLGRPEGRRVLDLGDDRLLERARFRQRRDLLACDARLLRRGGENDRAVLRAVIRSLVIELGRVVHLEEQTDQLPVRALGRAG